MRATRWVFAISAAAVVNSCIAACNRIPGTELHFRAKAEHATAAYLGNPASIEFQNVREVHISSHGKNIPVLCGEVNGKNKAGSDIGFTRFIYAGSTVSLDVAAKPADAKPPTNPAESSAVFEAEWAGSGCRS